MITSQKFLLTCCFSLVILLLGNFNVYGQQNPIKGTVLSAEDNLPLPGASVRVKGTSRGTVTNMDGVYEINAASDDVLIFSFVGMITQEIRVGNSSTVDVTLELDVRLIDEVVVLGYQSQRRADITGAVSVVKLDDALQQSNVNILNSLQGRIPGLQITSDGTPGGGNTNVRIRGFSTIGNTSPLYVIDGVPTDNIGPLNPDDIESIQVLKDAAAASIYGSRANNGVIVITTKRGTTSEPQISFNSFVGVQTIRNSMDMLDAQQWGDVYWQAQRNSGITPSHPLYGSGPQPVIPQFIDAEGNIPAANTNWMNEVFKPAMIQNYSLGITQATDNSNVYAGLNFADDSGIQQHTGYQRYNARLNASYTIKDRLTVGENLQVTYFKELRANQLSSALRQHPLIPVRDNVGNFGGPTDGLGDLLNPLGELHRNRTNWSENWRVFGNAYMDLKIIEGLNARTSLGVDYSNSSLRRFEPSFREGNVNNTDNFLTNSFSRNMTITWSNTVEYSKEIGRSRFNVLGGTELISFDSEFFNARRMGFILNDYSYAHLSAGTGIQTNGGGGTEWGLSSQFGKIDYIFNDRYYLSGTIRRDGSSRFGPENRYGVFPAVSAGWRISDEDFMTNLTAVDDLKFRVSWGQTGNQQIGDFGALNFYQTNPEYGGYDLGGTNTSIFPGYYRGTMGNPNLRWETQTQTNMGFDLSLLEGRLEMTTDYFFKTTTGMLLNPTLLAAYGAGAPPFVNAGELSNRGLEVAIGYRSDPSRAFRYTVDFNVGSYRNRVVSLGGEEFYLGANANRIQVGKPVSSFFGYVADGLFTTEEEVASHATQPGKGLGRIRYQDLNGDGVINQLDRTWIGDPNPDFIYGLNASASYGNFDFSIFFNGVYGNDIYNTMRGLTDFAYFPFNFSTRILESWSPENPGATIPSVNVTNPNDELRHSSYFVEDGSYIKLQSLVLGYTFPQNTLGAERIRVYVQGENLFVFSSYSGLDPEIGTAGPFNLGIDSQMYPQARAINFGVNVTF